MNNVVITRSKNQILDISEMITQLGMNPVEFPCIEIDSSSYKDSCLLYTSPSPRDATLSRMPSSA